MSTVFKNVPWSFSSSTVSATIHRPSTNLSLMTQRWMNTTFKPLRTPASSTFPVSSILSSPLFSQRGNLSASLATKIVWHTYGHHETFSQSPKRLKMHLCVFVLVCLHRAVCAVCCQFVLLPTVYHVPLSQHHRYVPRGKNSEQKKSKSSTASWIFANKCL